MFDTSPDITRKMCEMILMKTPLERLEMGCSMHETSKYLLTRAILEASPNITKKELKVELFLKFYSNDFDSFQKAKIVHHLRNLPC